MKSLLRIILTLGFLVQVIPQVILVGEDHGDDLKFDVTLQLEGKI